MSFLSRCGRARHVSGFNFYMTTLTKQYKIIKRICVFHMPQKLSAGYNVVDGFCFLTATLAGEFIKYPYRISLFDPVSTPSQDNSFSATLPLTFIGAVFISSNALVTFLERLFAEIAYIVSKSYSANISAFFRAVFPVALVGKILKTLSAYKTFVNLALEVFMLTFCNALTGAEFVLPNLCGGRICPSGNFFSASDTGECNVVSCFHLLT